MKLLLGYTGAIAVILIAIQFGIPNPQVFFSVHAALIVLGGTFFIALICFPVRVLFGMFRSVINVATGQSRREQIQLIEELADLAEVMNKKGHLFEEISSIKNHFLRDCVDLMENGGLSDTGLLDLLQKRLRLQP